MPRRLNALQTLARPLAWLFFGMLLLSLGAAYAALWAYRTIPVPPFFYYVTLQFLPHYLRAIVFIVLALVMTGIGVWQLSSMVIIELDRRANLMIKDHEVVVGYTATQRRRRIVVLSGGPGMMLLSALHERFDRITGIIPIQDPIEYYYRAASLGNAPNVYYVVPSGVGAEVRVTLDDGTQANVKQVDKDPKLVERHVHEMQLLPSSGTSAELGLTRLAREAIQEADAIVLGPGSLFEGILPNLLIPELQAAISASKARTIYICNLMSQPGLTTGMGVADHIRQFKRFGNFTPDYVLVNAQRIDPEINAIYAAMQQTPLAIDPEEYEETTALPGEQTGQQAHVIEGSIVLETDLSATVVQYHASIDQPGSGRAIQVLRHDPHKLADAIAILLRQPTR